MILCADHGVDPTTEAPTTRASTRRLLALGLDARALRRRPGGRRRHRVRASDGGRAAALRAADRLMAGPADAATRRVAAWRPHAAAVVRLRARALPGGGRVVEEELGYDALGWPSGAVPGHQNVLRLARVPASRTGASSAWRSPADARTATRAGATGAGDAGACARAAWGVDPAGAHELLRRVAARAPPSAGAVVVLGVVDLQRPPRETRPSACACAPTGGRAGRGRRRDAAPARARTSPCCGPQFETPAEVAWLAGYGDVVGHVGGAGGSRRRRDRRRVLSPGLVANVAAAAGSHEDVLAAGGRLGGLLAAGLTRAARRPLARTCWTSRERGSDVDFVHDVIAWKRDGNELDEGARARVRRGRGRAAPSRSYQASALLMAMVLRGLSDGETLSLARAMVDSGKMLDLSVSAAPCSTSTRAAAWATR